MLKNVPGKGGKKRIEEETIETVRYSGVENKGCAPPTQGSPERSIVSPLYSLSSHFFPRLLPRERLTVTLATEGEGRRATIEGDSRFGDF